MAFCSITKWEFSRKSKKLFPLSNNNERIVFQLFSLVKSVVANRYRDVLREFEELDEKNTRRLTQEDMYQLLKRWHTIQKKNLFPYICFLSYYKDFIVMWLVTVKTCQYLTLEYNSLIATAHESKSEWMHEYQMNNWSVFRHNVFISISFW